MKYLKRVEGDCDTCVLKTTRACIKVRCYMYHNFRLATPDEIAAYKRKHPESLAMKLSKYVHDHCTGVPHDIGLKLYDIVRAHPSELPKEASDGK